MEGDSQETQQCKIGPFVFPRLGQLFAPCDRNPQDDHAHRETQPDHGDGRDISQSNFGGDEGSAPDGHGKDGFQDGDKLGFGHGSHFEGKVSQL